MTESGREKVLEEALRPFAEYADRNRRLPADHIITQGSRFAKRQLTIGDCYAAADALASPSTQEPALRGGGPLDRQGMNEILERLADLHKQATVERSHYYVGKCVRDAISTIAELEKRIGELEAENAHANGVAMGVAVALDQTKQALTAERQRRESAEAALSDVLASGGNSARLAEQEGNPHADIPIGCHPYKHAAAHFSRYGHADDLSEEGKGG